MMKKTMFWLKDRRVLAALWILIGIISALSKMSATRHNNYDIFRYVFYNTWHQTSLYAPSTDGGYWDINHYGPLFSVIIAPFAVLPTWLGLLLWCTMLAAFLYWAVSRYCQTTDPTPTLPSREGVQSNTQHPAPNTQHPAPNTQHPTPNTQHPTPNTQHPAPNTQHLTLNTQHLTRPFIIWFCAHELLTALFMQQFNVAIAGIILLSYYFVEKERDEYATLFVVIGTLVKLYGIVGLAFFFFSRHKVRYVLSLAGWTAVLICLPMLISSPEYQIGQYQEWFETLAGKNSDNLLSVMQNVSLLGIVRKTLYIISGGYVVNDMLTGGKTLEYSDIWLILAAMAVMAVGYFRIGQWKNVAFRQTVLAAVMMFVCLFSTGTESSGYIIALTGCVIWYCAAPWQRSQWDIALMVFAFILTSLSPSDLFPRFLKEHYVLPFALKALPVSLIWIKLAWELIAKNYEPKELQN